MEVTRAHPPTTSIPRRAGEEVYPGGPRWELGPPITVLNDDEVFVFGSNAAGFHGAGAAGQAMRGNADRHWRSDSAFLNAMNSPAGSTARTGLWTIYGVGRGPARGREGKSYAVQTVLRPGLKRSTSLDDIALQLQALCRFAAARPHLSFLIVPLGEQLAGYSRQEMSAVWRRVAEHAGGTLPVNFRFVQGDGSPASPGTDRSSLQGAP